MNYPYSLDFPINATLPSNAHLYDGVITCIIRFIFNKQNMLFEHPATMRHASMYREHREAAGLTGNVIRLSVGLEDGIDLIEDLGRALD